MPLVNPVARSSQLFCLRLFRPWWRDTQSRRRFSPAPGNGAAVYYTGVAAGVTDRVKHAGLIGDADPCTNADQHAPVVSFVVALNH